MLMRQLTDDKLAQHAYLIGCPGTGEAIVIDPQRDVDRYFACAAREGLRIVAVADTHIHADFVSGAREMVARAPDLRLYLSDEGGAEWRCAWPDADGAHVTRLRDGDRFAIGQVVFRAWHTPGHTPEHLAFVVSDAASVDNTPMAVLTGDFVFAGDLGRPDLLDAAVGEHGSARPSAARLHASVHQFLALPDFLQIWPGHGAGSACGKGRTAVPMSTVGYERRTSPALAVAMRGPEPFVDFVLQGQAEPPAYFGRTKLLNRSGPPVWGRLPEPVRLTARQLAGLTDVPIVQIVDTRLDRQVVFAGHLRRSLHIPLDRTFPTMAGSLLEPEAPVVLLVYEDELEEAVRDLTRIGVDQVLAWAPPSMLADTLLASRLTQIESIDFSELERRAREAPTEILDVRSAAEHAERAIPGARNIPHTRLRPRVAEIATRGPLYVHCLSGARAAASVLFLARLGIPAVHVDGRFTAWPTEARARHGS